MDGTAAHIQPELSRVSHTNQHVANGESGTKFDIYTTLAQTNNAMSNENKTVPFINNVTIKSDNGELTRLRALFDDGAMVNAMCTTVFEAVKHRLRGWTRSAQTLRMANGTVIPATAQWTGRIQVGTAEVQATFIVFNSGGGWAFLAGKPLLQTLNAVHDYAMDRLTVTDGKAVTTLSNRYYDAIHDRIMESKHRTLDIKQRPQQQTQLAEAYIVQPEYILNAVTIGHDLSETEKEQVRNFITEYADVFACSIKEVLPIPGATINLNIPASASFTTTIRQRPLSPPQKAFMHKWVQQMIDTNMIEPADIAHIKHVAPTVLTKKRTTIK